MIGIVNHNPLTISVILDRGTFRNQLISTDDILNNTWKEKIQAFSSSPRDGRHKVLFVEKLSGLQFMLRSGFEADPFKIVLYDTCNIINKIRGIEIVDAKMGAGETWSVYKLLPERFNSSLLETSLGVPDNIMKIDSKKIDADKTKVDLPRRKKPASLDEINKTMKKLTADPVKEKEEAKPQEAVAEEQKPKEAAKPAKEKPKKVKLESHKLFG